MFEWGARKGPDVLLRAYARGRAEEPFLIQYVTHGLNRLFGSGNPLLPVSGRCRSVAVAMPRTATWLTFQSTKATSLPSGDTIAPSWAAAQTVRVTGSPMTWHTMWR